MVWLVGFMCFLQNKKSIANNQMGSRNRFKKSNDSFSFTPPAGGSLSTEGRRAARRSAGTRRSVTPAAAATATGSVVRMGGEEYNMDDPEQRTAYDTAQKTELDRQGPMADIRGGDGLKDTGSRMAPAPRDPNNTGAKGTSMSYAGFMKDIGTPQKIEVRDTFSSENLPGTASYGASFALNSGENQRSFDADAAIAQAVDGRIVPKVTINAANSGKMASMFENQRQLTPGEGSFSSNPAKLGVMDTSVPTGQGNTEADNLARRAAFLDADNSLAGLRAVEGLQGMVTQGGKNFVRDSSAEGGLKEIGQDEYRARRRGGIIPAAKGKAGARRAATGVDSQTAATEAPSDVENPAVIGEDGKIETIDNSNAMHGARAGFASARKVDNKLSRL